MELRDVATLKAENRFVIKWINSEVIEWSRGHYVFGESNIETDLLAIPKPSLELDCLLDHYIHILIQAMTSVSGIWPNDNNCSILLNVY